MLDIRAESAYFLTPYIVSLNAGFYSSGKEAMGHSVSARKRERQNTKRQERNRANRGVLKKELKKFEKLVAEKPVQGKAEFQKIQSALDKAARKGAIPKGRASRKAARLASRIAKAAAKPAPAPTAKAAK